MKSKYDSNTNRFKTSDIKLHKFTDGDYEATHRFQGTLYESEYFDTREEARREAVKILNEIKENGGKTEGMCKY